MQFTFIHFVCDFFLKSGKGSNLGPLGYKRDFNHCISFFHLKLMLYIYIYKVLIIVQVQYKKSIFFSLLGIVLYYNCIEPDVTFNSLVLFSVCQIPIENCPSDGLKFIKSKVMLLKSIVMNHHH